MAMLQVLTAVNSEPIDPEFVWPMNKKRLRVRAVTISEGRLRLQIAPVDRQDDRR